MHKQVVNIQTLIKENIGLNTKLLKEPRKAKILVDVLVTYRISNLIRFYFFFLNRSIMFSRPFPLIAITMDRTKAMSASIVVKFM
jgi:hypothetical protein